MRKTRSRSLGVPPRSTVALSCGLPKTSSSSLYRCEWSPLASPFPTLTHTTVRLCLRPRGMTCCYSCFAPCILISPWDLKFAQFTVLRRASVSCRWAPWGSCGYTDPHRLASARLRCRADLYHCSWLPFLYILVSSAGLAQRFFFSFLDHWENTILLLWPLSSLLCAAI